MMTTALKHLAERGADGCFVDWVSLKGWYQKVGFEKWERGYREAWRDVS
jgi:beta-N-acetylhexosaminidase